MSLAGVEEQKKGKGRNGKASKNAFSCSIQTTTVNNVRVPVKRACACVSAQEDACVDLTRVRQCTNSCCVKQSRVVVVVVAYFSYWLPLDRKILVRSFANFRFIVIVVIIVVKVVVALVGAKAII